MQICKSLEEARQVPGVVHIEAGKVIKAYLAGDELPAHCKPGPERPLTPAEKVAGLASQLGMTVAELKQALK